MPVFPPATAPTVPAAGRIPLATTTIAVLDHVQAEPYEAETWPVVSSGTRAVIGAPTGREGRASGSAETIDAVLNADPVQVTHGQRVLDERTGESWDVVWVQDRRGLGLDHVRAGLRRVVR